MSETLVRPAVKIKQLCYGCSQWTTFTLVNRRTAKTEFHYNPHGEPCERNDITVAVLDSHEKLGS